MPPLSSLSHDNIPSPHRPLNTSATELLTPAHCSSADLQNHIGHIFPGGGVVAVTASEGAGQLWVSIVKIRARGHQPLLFFTPCGAFPVWGMLEVNMVAVEGACASVFLHERTYPKKEKQSQLDAEGSSYF